MPAVRVLPDSVINLISAGEVVERPASVVKELVENALDAGAGEIAVELEQGGRQSIVVRDDGSGMSRHDLLLSIQRHATSKITGREDLEHLSTLGFRGEALPSIAAVTHLTVTTSDGTDAWELVIDGGELRGVSPAARTRGTTVSASGLFFNQTARRKFLRQQATELSWIERLLTGCALSRPDVAFLLTHNGRELFRLPAGESRAERIRRRFALSAASPASFGEGTAKDVSAKVLCFQECLWNRRDHQYVLVNGRLVQAPMVSAPLDLALAGPAGFPLVLAEIILSPSSVDVNVHPSKREVRFRDPSAVRAAVEAAIADMVGERRAALLNARTGAASRISSAAPIGSGKPSAEYSPGLFKSAMMVQMPTAHLTVEADTGSSVVPIVQVGRSYLVTATESGIALIDQHAAHERILYEAVLSSMRRGAGTGQQRLLLPEVVRLDGEEAECLEAYSAIIESAGFETHIEGDTLVLTGVPGGVFHGMPALREILKSLMDPGTEDRPVDEKVAAAAACAGAVKFGDALAGEETRMLVDMLFATSDPFHCPHGRPTLIEISYLELEKRFGR
jgi:DNA mismatch repair protein MutL